MPAIVRKPMKIDKATHNPTNPPALYRTSIDPMLPIDTRI